MPTIIDKNGDKKRYRIVGNLILERFQYDNHVIYTDPINFYCVVTSRRMQLKSHQTGEDRYITYGTRELIPEELFLGDYAQNHGLSGGYDVCDFDVEGFGGNHPEGYLESVRGATGYGIYNEAIDANSPPKGYWGQHYIDKLAWIKPKVKRICIIPNWDFKFKGTDQEEMELEFKCSEKS